MIRRLATTKDADKFLAQLDAKAFRQVGRKIFALADHPTPPDSSKLEGSKYYRADQGEYRIVYFLNQKPCMSSSSANAMMMKSTLN